MLKKPTQIPLSLAWICTVQNVQGLAWSQRYFSYGQTYVELSRVRTIKREFNDGATKADPRALEKYQQMKSLRMFQTDL